MFSENRILETSATAFAAGDDADPCIPLAQAAAELPCRRAGKPTHVQTLHDWRGTGYRGTKLRAVKLGGIWHTKRSWLAEFFAAITAASEGRVTGATVASPASRTKTSVRRASEAAGRQLDAIGVGV